MKSALLLPRWMDLVAATPYVLAATALHVAIFLFVCLHCLRRPREATSALLWIFLCWSFPVLGPLLYLAFGVDRVPVKGWRKQSADREFLAARRARAEPNLPLAYWLEVHDRSRISPSSPVAEAIDRALDRVIPDYPSLGGNSIQLLICGDEAYPPMLEAIAAAEHHVHLQSFIIRDDAIGRDFMDLLARKAASGVKVRLMYDRFGSTHAVWRGLFRRYAHTPNLRIEGWTQANVLKRQFQFNLRNHRKTLVVDGRRAFVGGINLHVENITRPGRPPPIRDYHFELRGPAVQEIQYAFLRDWYFMADEDPESLLCAEHFPPLAPAGPAVVRAIHSGPTEDERHNFIYALFLCITEARRELIAVTPYFIPTPDILRALQASAIRGVKTTLIVPADNNHVYAGMAARARYQGLLAAGVRVFERRAPFIHAKALVLDESVAVVGTGNIDVRSLRLNYETNLMVFDPDFARVVKAALESELTFSREVFLADWLKRPLRQRLAENFCNLLTPIV